MPSSSHEPTPHIDARQTTASSGETSDSLNLRNQARHAKRCLFEARVVGMIIVACMVTTSVIMGTTGYVSPQQRPASPELLFGIPAWVVHGLFIPWLAMIAVTWLFALVILKDDEPLESSH